MSAALTAHDAWIEREYAKLTRRQASFIYCVRRASTNTVKIGVSINPTARIAALVTGAGEPLEVVAVFKGDRQTEQFLHRLLDEVRFFGEWFHDCPKLRFVIAGFEKSGR